MKRINLIRVCFRFVKKRTIGVCMSFILFNLNLYAQPAGHFTKIKVEDPLRITLSQSEENSIRMEGNENMSDKIKTDISGETLKISFTGKIKKEEKINVIIGIKSLTGLDIAGAAEVVSENQLNCDKLDIESSGSGTVNLNLIANEVNAKISGAGELKLSGKAQRMDASVSGAGEIKAFGFETHHSKIKISGAGDAKINVVQSLDADVSGAGSVVYKGNPEERNVNISGAGSVRQSDGKEKDEKITVDIDLNMDDFSIEEDTVNSENPDTTRINLKKMKVLIIENDNDFKSEYPKEKKGKKDRKHNRNKHWAGLYLGVNGYSTPQYSLNLPAKSAFLDLDYAKSLHFAFNFFEKDIRLHRDFAMIVTGLGVDFNTYALRNNISLQANSNRVWGVTDTINKFTKNKWKTTFVDIPVLLAFNTHPNPDKAFHLAAGMIFGYNIASKTKQRFDVGGDAVTAKVRNDYNLNPFRYSATVQMGYGNYNLYASYALNPLFRGGKGPELYPFTVGIRLLGL